MERNKNKKNIIIIALVIVILLIILWVNGIIPIQIAKIYGTIYMDVNFPKMHLKYSNIEWSKYHDAYIIQFKDKKDKIYSCTIGPKNFPISIGQGIVAIQEEYRRY